MNIDFNSKPEVAASLLVTDATTDQEYRAIDRRLRNVHTALKRQYREARDADDRDLWLESERRRSFVAAVMSEAQEIILRAQEDRLRKREDEEAAAAAKLAAAAERQKAGTDGAARLPDPLPPHLEKIGKDALVIRENFKKALLLKVPRDDAIGFFIGVHVASLTAHRDAMDAGLRAIILRINALEKKVAEVSKR